MFLRMTLAVNDLVFDTETDGDYSLLAITPIEGVQIANTGEISALVDATDRDALHTAPLVGAGATITLWGKDNEWDEWEQLRHFIGVIHMTQLVDNQVEIVLRSKYAHILEAEPVKWNAADHKRRHPDDTALDYLQEMERVGRGVTL